MIGMTKKGSLRKVKCVLLGDSQVGKTTMFNTCVINDENNKKADLCNCGSFNVTVDNTEYTIEIHDTAGNPTELKLISSLTFPRTDIFVLCYNVTNHTTLENVEEVWLKEIEKFRKKTKTILLGLKTDQRVDKGAHHKPVSYYQAKDFAEKHLLTGFTECCAFDPIRVENFKKFVVECHADDNKDNCVIQ